MNKKFLSAILFGALMVSSTGTFVSCKDYDDDIDAINKELTDIKSQLAALQTEVDGGNWVTELVDVEGGFKKWGYELAQREFGDALADGRLVIKDCIADAFLQNTLLIPEEYSVIATLNLNGDYVSDQLAATPPPTLSVM